MTQVKADLTCASVAAASVLAKTTRDAMMVDLARAHPHFGWDANKGYASDEHRRPASRARPLRSAPPKLESDFLSRTGMALPGRDAILPAMPPIARLAWTAVDCHDPRALAEFYSAITGWPIDEQRLRRRLGRR